MNLLLTRPLRLRIASQVPIQVKCKALFARSTNIIMNFKSTGGEMQQRSFKQRRWFHIVQLGDARLPDSYRNLHVVEDGDEGGNCNDGDSGRTLGVGAIKADIMITDPPYLLLERRRKGGDLRDAKRVVKKVDNDDAVPRFGNVQDYRVFTAAWMKSALSTTMKSGAPMIIWSNSLGKAPIISAAKELEYHLVGEYIWGKFSSANESKESSKNEKLVRIYESALIFMPDKSPSLNSDKDPIIYPSKPDHTCKPWFVISNYHDSHSSDSSFSNSSTNSSSTIHPHPCFKPFDALEPLLREWTKPGDIVLDPFVGGGGIPKALKSIGDRHYVGIEKLPFWVDFVRRELK